MRDRASICGRNRRAPVRGRRSISGAGAFFTNIQTSRIKIKSNYWGKDPSSMSPGAFTLTAQTYSLNILPRAERAEGHYQLQKWKWGGQEKCAG